MEGLRPSMLEARRLVAIPSADRTQELTQIVYVPVLALGFTTMPRYARAHTARPECATDVDIVSGLDIEPSPTTNLSSGFRTTSQNQCVGSGMRAQLHSFLRSQIRSAPLSSERQPVNGLAFVDDVEAAAIG